MSRDTTYTLRTEDDDTGMLDIEFGDGCKLTLNLYEVLDSATDEQRKHIARALVGVDNITDAIMARLADRYTYGWEMCDEGQRRLRFLAAVENTCLSGFRWNTLNGLNNAIRDVARAQIENNRSERRARNFFAMASEAQEQGRIVIDGDPEKRLYDFLVECGMAGTRDDWTEQKAARDAEQELVDALRAHINQKLDEAAAGMPKPPSRTWDEVFPAIVTDARNALDEAGVFTDLVF